MEFDTQVKLAIYGHFAEAGQRPTPADVAGRVRSDAKDVLAAYQRLRTQRVLALEADGAAIRMAPPFSGVARVVLLVPTHRKKERRRPFGAA